MKSDQHAAPGGSPPWAGGSSRVLCWDNRIRLTSQLGLALVWPLLSVSQQVGLEVAG